MNHYSLLISESIWVNHHHSHTWNLRLFLGIIPHNLGITIYSRGLSVPDDGQHRALGEENTRNMLWNTRKYHCKRLWNIWRLWKTCRRKISGFESKLHARVHGLWSGVLSKNEFKVYIYITPFWVNTFLVCFEHSCWSSPVLRLENSNQRQLI